MPQPSSPHNPRHPAAEPAPRRLISPEERFASPAQAPPTQYEEPLNDPFVAEPPAVTRLDDEMARRHLPPRQRHKHERTLKKRQATSKHSALKLETLKPAAQKRPRASHETVPHEQRAQAEREFAQQVRSAPPKPAPKKRRRMPVWIKRLLLLVAVIFLGQLGFAAFTAPQMNIKSVAITGAQVTPESQIQPLVARLVGQNWIRANRAAVEKAVETLPTVASAHIIRLPVWPPKVQLRIEERQAVVQVGSGNEWWVIDADGVPFRRARAEDGNLYQVVAPEFSPRQGQKLDPKVWARASELNSAILEDNRIVAGESAPSNDGPVQEPYWQLRRIYFDKDGLASLRLTGKGQLAKHDEMLLRLGDDHWQEKLARARIALSYFDKTGRRAEELDMVSLERPVWRPIGAQIATKPDTEDAGHNGEARTG